MRIQRRFDRGVCISACTRDDSTRNRVGFGISIVDGIHRHGDTAGIGDRAINIRFGRTGK